MLKKTADIVVNILPLFNTNNMERGAGENQAQAPDGIAIDGCPLQAPQCQEEPQIVFWLAGARKAIALKQTLQLMLWLSLHHTNRQSGGSGILPMGRQNIESIAHVVGLHPTRVRHILKARGGTWWQCLPESRVRLFSQEKIGAYLAKRAADSGVGDPGEPDIRCQMPLVVFRVGQLAFEASIFTAWVAERFPNGLQTTWDELTRLWGHPQAQIKYWLTYNDPITFKSGGFDGR